MQRLEHNPFGIMHPLKAGSVGEPDTVFVALVTFVLAYYSLYTDGLVPLVVYGAVGPTLCLRQAQVGSSGPSKVSGVNRMPQNRSS